MVQADETGFKAFWECFAEGFVCTLPLWKKGNGTGKAKIAAALSRTEQGIPIVSADEGRSRHPEQNTSSGHRRVPREETRGGARWPNVRRADLLTPDQGCRYVRQRAEITPKWICFVVLGTESGMVHGAQHAYIWKNSKRIASISS